MARLPQAQTVTLGGKSCLGGALGPGAPTTASKTRPGSVIVAADLGAPTAKRQGAEAVTARVGIFRFSQLDDKEVVSLAEGRGDSAGLTARRDD
jgi:hypothetical protein